MSFAKLLFSSSVLILGGCMGAPGNKVTRGYDLELTHPAPYATFIQVSPGHVGAPLPRVEEIKSPQFSLYLRRQIGCVRDTARPPEPLGGKRVPAAYMVPVVCP
jgi:hypothetical protein